MLKNKKTGVRINLIFLFVFMFFIFLMIKSGYSVICFLDDAPVIGYNVMVYDGITKSYKGTLESLNYEINIGDILLIDLWDTYDTKNNIEYEKIFLLKNDFNDYDGLKYSLYEYNFSKIFTSRTNSKIDFYNIYLGYSLPYNQKQYYYLKTKVYNGYYEGNDIDFLIAPEEPGFYNIGIVVGDTCAKEDVEVSPDILVVEREYEMVNEDLPSNVLNCDGSLSINTSSNEKVLVNIGDLCNDINVYNQPNSKIFFNYTGSNYNFNNPKNVNINLYYTNKLYLDLGTGEISYNIISKLNEFNDGSHNIVLSNSKYTFVNLVSHNIPFFTGLDFVVTLNNFEGNITYNFNSDSNIQGKLYINNSKNKRIDFYTNTGNTNLDLLICLIGNVYENNNFNFRKNFAFEIQTNFNGDTFLFINNNISNSYIYTDGSISFIEFDKNCSYNFHNGKTFNIYNNIFNFSNSRSAFEVKYNTFNVYHNIFYIDYNGSKPEMVMLPGGGILNSGINFILKPGSVFPNNLILADINLENVIEGYEDYKGYKYPYTYHINPYLNIVVPIKLYTNLTEITESEFNSPPVADIDVPTTAKVNEIVTWKDKSFDTDGTITNRIMIIDNVKYVNQTSGTFTSNKPGVITLTLTVTDNEGLKDTESVITTFLAEDDECANNQEPFFNLSYEALGNNRYKFYVTDEYDVEGDDISYVWLINGEEINTKEIITTLLYNQTIYLTGIDKCNVIQRFKHFTVNKNYDRNKAPTLTLNCIPSRLTPESNISCSIEYNLNGNNLSTINWYLDAYSRTDLTNKDSGKFVISDTLEHIISVELVTDNYIQTAFYSIKLNENEIIVTDNNIIGLENQNNKSYLDKDILGEINLISDEPLETADNMVELVNNFSNIGGYIMIFGIISLFIFGISFLFTLLKLMLGRVILK